MAKEPVSESDLAGRLARLETVVDRQAARLDEAVDGEVHRLKTELAETRAALKEARRRAREADDTANWLMGRTDELGEDKTTKKQVQGEIRRLNPAHVERYWDRGRVRVRAVQGSA